MPGKSYIERINLNGRILFTVTSNPNGVLPGNAGDMALRTDAPNGTVYVNVDGALVWVDLSTLSAPSPWVRVGTTVELIIGTDQVGVGTVAPASKLHVDSLAAPTVPILTLANLASNWQDFVGSGSPEGVITASRGDTFHDDLGNLWLKVAGDATNTGWQQVLTVADGPFWHQDGNAFGALGTLGTLDPFDLRFITNGLERARILSTGQFLVNAVAPVGAELLRVNGDGRFDGNLVVAGDLVVQGTTVSVDAETVLLADNHLYINAGYTPPAAQTGGLVVNYLPIAVVDTVGVGGFTAGVPAVSNPTVITVGLGTFAVGQFIQVSGTGPDPDFPINNGLYEVLSHVGTVLTIRGIGLVGTVEDFTQNQFTTDATVAGSITRLNISVNRTGTDGLWEEGKGSVTPIVFDDFVTATTVAGRVLDTEYDVGASVVGVVTFDSATDVVVGAYPVEVEFGVATAYPVGTSITVGNSAGSATFLMLTADIKPTVAGIYRVPILRRDAAAPWTATGKVRVTITSGAVGGTGHVRLVYAPTPNP